jgi:2-methylcitrate dehydratase
MTKETARSDWNATSVGAIARAVAAPFALSQEAILRAKLLLLDSLGCAFAALDDPVARSVLHVVRSDGDCPIIGMDVKTDIFGAVLMNGTLIRVLDLNDYMISDFNGEPETGGHPSDNIAAALAVATARKKWGADVLAAIAAGYDVYARLQSLMDRARGWDTVTVSGFAAPAIAGRLMGLDAEKLAHAIALGAARAATPNIVRGGDISASKSIANALVAQSGVQATLLAEQGVTGPLTILDDERGLNQLFAGASPEMLGAPIDGSAILRAHVKTYPCVNTAQSAVAAAIQLHKAVKNHIGRIARIEVTMPDYRVIRRHQDDEGRKDPKSREAADHSFPFLIAVALKDGRLGPAQFDNERWLDPVIRSLMAKIALKRDASMNRRAEHGYPCAMRIVLNDGREHATEVPSPPGFSRNGLDESAVIDKFRTVTESVPQLNPDRIIDAVMSLDRSPSTAALDAAITKRKKK